VASSKDPFVPALRAELEAVVARYEALARAHQEALAAARDQEVTKLRTDLATLLADRERSKMAEVDGKARLAQGAARVEQLERELREAKEAVEKERRVAREAQQRVEAAQAELREAVAKERADAKAALDVARSEARAALERERGEAKVVLERELRSAAEKVGKAEALALAARKNSERLGADLELARSAAASLGEAFASERAFVEAAVGLDGTLLLEAIRGVLGCDPAATPAVYSELKSRKADVVLTHVLKERGRTASSAPLSERERTALRRLADAAGCELIVPDHGTRFSPSNMEKASTLSDPAEEGNVIDTLVPGLRLASTEGALVFPRVVVATGLRLVRALRQRAAFRVAALGPAGVPCWHACQSHWSGRPPHCRCCHRRGAGGLRGRRRLRGPAG
jgi:hypothetical protein